MTARSPGAPTTTWRVSRSVVFGRTGLIATSQPLASAAGLEVFRNGGNAIDAAVTAAAVLSVVEPTMTGIGVDLFAIVHDGATGRTRGLNASGRSPHAASLDQRHELGRTSIPDHGVLSVTAPGAVDGWSQLLSEHGTLPLRQALAPAIVCARDGFPVAEVVARQWREAARMLAAEPAAAAAFLPRGHAPLSGEVFACPALASTLELIETDDRDVLYRGDLGLLGHNSADYLHLVLEALAIAFADRDAYLADPDAVPDTTLDRLVSRDYARSRRPGITRNRSRAHAPGHVGPGHDPCADTSGALQGTGDTVCLAAADDRGNLISLIQSLYTGFGAGESRLGFRFMLSRCLSGPRRSRPNQESQRRLAAK